jgi:hypothetical protein
MWAVYSYNLSIGPQSKPRKKATRITPESAETTYIFTLVARKLSL